VLNTGFKKRIYNPNIIMCIEMLKRFKIFDIKIVHYIMYIRSKRGQIKKQKGAEEGGVSQTL
jgi:hypothetical protein